MEKKDWTVPAYNAAVNAARENQTARRRWAGQNQWDRENMVTESTRFTLEEDERLEACLWEARVTRYTLIAYLLKLWMTAWESYGEGQ